jgi:hypothetical protein
MRLLLALATLSLAPSLAQAAVDCSIITPGDAAQPNQYNKYLTTITLAEEAGPQTTQFVFVKADQSIVKMGRDEYYARKDLSDLDGVLYFTLQHASPGEYLLSFGHVDAANRDLDTVGYSTGGLAGNGVSLTAFKERMLAMCYVRK